PIKWHWSLPFLFFPFFLPLPSSPLPFPSSFFPFFPPLFFFFPPFPSFPLFLSLLSLSLSPLFSPPLPPSFLSSSFFLPPFFP
ncbi:hypothetical protein ACXWR7_12015, partial [Streptococcus pyogenes]